MNPLPSPVARNQVSPLSTGEAVPKAAGPTPEITQDPASQISIQIRILLLTGCLAAAVVTLLFCRIQPHTLTWAAILLRATGYIALAAISGTIGAAIPWLFLKTKPTFADLLRSVAVAWIFFPCILLFYLRQSPWIYLVIALTTIVSAHNLRRLFPAAAKNNQLPHHHTSVLPSLYGLPIADFRPFRSAFIAICAQTALFCAVADRLLLAGIFLSASLFLFTWRWSTFDTSITLTGKRSSTLLCTFALALTVFALLPWLSAKSHDFFGPNIQFHRPPHLVQRPVEPDIPSAEYVGIILWPPPKKKTEIVPPTPRVHSFAIGRAAKPVVIPFDGPYWYFKSPSIRPGLRAHIAHGNATDVTIRSSDWWPLLMQAHQNLGLPIDLSCCSEIDVAIINADTRPGVIALALRLTDSLSVAKSIQTLPDQIILSTVTALIPINRPPVNEILRFPLPHSASMRQFNQIDVLYHPASDRARGAARVSIQSFTLIPK